MARILIIEDEEGIVSFLKQGLEEEQFKIESCNNGEDGLSMALSGQFDLILLDWMLPGITGIELCEKFREENKTTPIIFLTAKDTLDETILGLQTGANDYIKKPFHFEELIERIRVQLRANIKNKQLLVLGDITLNTEKHQVYKNNQEIYLTQKEFALLEYLMQNKGEVCKRTTIIEKVWDIHFDYNTAVIEVYINSLRKKLNLSEEHNYIKTVRGIGYVADEK
jgi:two-component system copper resistance phosphate regulon response regulator CusR